MFEKASRLKLRFPSTRGLLVVEQLWDMPLTSRDGFNLDEIAIELNKKIESSSSRSFVTDSTPANDELKLQFEIVKHIIQVKLSDAKASKESAAKQERKKQLLAILADKEDEALAKMSKEEILAELEALS